MMKPDYVAKKSILGECGGKIFICILFCWLIVPIFLMIYMIIEAKKFRIEFYKDKVIMYRGFFHTEERQSILTTIVGVRINRSIAGNIFNYGDVVVDMVGRWDIDTRAIKDPVALKNYLESVMTNAGTKNFNQFIVD